MASNTEASRELVVRIELASLELEYLTAAVAAEVVMMGLAGDLIPQSFTGHGNRRKPVTLQ